LRDGVGNGKEEASERKSGARLKVAGTGERRTLSASELLSRSRDSCRGEDKKKAWAYGFLWRGRALKKGQGGEADYEKVPCTVEENWDNQIGKGKKVFREAKEGGGKAGRYPIAPVLRTELFLSPPGVVW